VVLVNTDQKVLTYTSVLITMIPMSALCHSLRDNLPTYAAFTLSGFDDQERNLTFLKTIPKI